ncbi:MAG: hypothetical protein EOO38_21685, partial [Cytophagaceae bacterium]
MDITGAVLSAQTQMPCGASGLTRTVYLSSGDGSKAISIVESDTAGNTGSTSISVVNDTTAPLLTQTTASPTSYSKIDTLTLGGACESTRIVIVSLGGVEDGRYTCAGSLWSYTTTAKTTDATRVYTITEADGAGNTSSVSTTWVRDTVAPPFTFANGTASSTETVNGNNYTFSGDCDSTANTATSSILVTGPGISGSAVVNCSLGHWSYAAPTQPTNGTYAYVFTQTDRATNGTTINGNWIRSGQGPVFTAASTLLKSNGNTVTFSGACESAYPILVSSGPGSPSAPSCTSNAWSFTTPSIGTDGTVTYVLTQQNALNDVSTLTLNFQRDTVRPVMTGLFINNGDLETARFNVKIDMTATDAANPITKVCLLQVAWPDTSTPPSPTSAPLSTDSCWQSLAALGI